MQSNGDVKSYRAGMQKDPLYLQRRTSEPCVLYVAEWGPLRAVLPPNIVNTLAEMSVIYEKDGAVLQTSSHGFSDAGEISIFSLKSELVSQLDRRSQDAQLGAEERKHLCTFLSLVKEMNQPEYGSDGNVIKCASYDTWGMFIFQKVVTLCGGRAKAFMPATHHAAPARGPQAAAEAHRQQGSAALPPPPICSAGATHHVHVRPVHDCHGKDSRDSTFYV